MSPTPSALEVQPVVMAGGSGTRLWPLSRAAYPKQFLVLDGQASLLQQAATRLAHLASPQWTMRPLMVVGNEQHRFLMLDQLRELEGAAPTVVLEPVGRNTAPALTLAALQAAGDGLDPVLVVTPADQTVTDEAAFGAAMREAILGAAEGEIVILGVHPDRPETGYGYIRSGTKTASGRYAVDRFVEKPDLDTARKYLAAGGYYWNGGIFVLRASVWLRALDTYRADIEAATRKAFDERTVDGAFVRPGAAAFAAVPAESVDYAVMEKCTAGGTPITMVPLVAGWNDLGAWDAVWQVADKDEQGNAASGDTIVRDSSNTLVHSTSRLVSVIGVKDVVVVETPDAVLVSDRTSSQRVKAIVGDLDEAQRGEHALHRKVHRPWGWYDSIDAGARFQVKRIMVKPGASLSLQKHHHRAEHWIVVTGTAEVTCDDRTMLLTENQSTYIPLGSVHRLANPGKVPLEIIEVQSGAYLGEDDIVRFEDTYGRC
jgi:mannose-1-phosphate guanylyltransferase/mannose-6-phosphate isomerase